MLLGDIPRAAGVVETAPGRRTPQLEHTLGLVCCPRAVQPRDAAPAWTGMSILVWTTEGAEALKRSESARAVQFSHGRDQLAKTIPTMS
jgi:hypothetical protein